MPAKRGKAAAPDMRPKPARDSVSTVADLSTHPQLRRTQFTTPKGDVSMPALAASWPGQPERLGDVPTVGQHTEQVRKEFA